MKQSKNNQRRRAQLLHKLHWNQTLGSLMLDIPWIKRTSPLILRQVRIVNACCAELERLNHEDGPSDDRTAA